MAAINLKALNFADQHHIHHWHGTGDLVGTEDIVLNTDGKYPKGTRYTNTTNGKVYERLVDHAAGAGVIGDFAFHAGTSVGTAPTISGKTTTDATHVTVTLDMAVTTSGVTGWSFRKGGVNLAASAVTGSGTTALVFTVATMANGDVIDVSYNPSTGDTVNQHGVELATVTNSSVTNTL